MISCQKLNTISVKKKIPAEIHVRDLGKEVIIYNYRIYHAGKELDVTATGGSTC